MNNDIIKAYWLHYVKDVLGIVYPNISKEQFISTKLNFYAGALGCLYGILSGICKNELENNVNIKNINEELLEWEKNVSNGIVDIYEYYTSDTN